MKKYKTTAEFINDTRYKTNLFLMIFPVAPVLIIILVLLLGWVPILGIPLAIVGGFVPAYLVWKSNRGELNG